MRSLLSGDVISKYENALVYDVSLPAVKPGKANEWVSLDECRRFSSSAHAIPEWACRACGRAHPDSSNAMALCDDPTALPIVLTVRLGRFLDVSEEMPARARFRRLPARAHFRLPRVLRFSQRSWTNKNALLQEWRSRVSKEVWGLPPERMRSLFGFLAFVLHFLDVIPG